MKMSLSFVRWLVVFIIHFTEVRTLRIVNQRWGMRDITTVRRDTLLEAVRSTTSEGGMKQPPQPQPQQRKSTEDSKVVKEREEILFVLDKPN